MVAQKFGRADINEQTNPNTAKEKTDKPMLKASQRVPTTGMVGGTANTVSRYAAGGRVSIAPYNEGGFRNAAMEHKR